MWPPDLEQPAIGACWRRAPTTPTTLARSPIRIDGRSEKCHPTPPQPFYDYYLLPNHFLVAETLGGSRMNAAAWALSLIVGQAAPVQPPSFNPDSGARFGVPSQPAPSQPTPPPTSRFDVPLAAGGNRFESPGGSGARLAPPATSRFGEPPASPPAPQPAVRPAGGVKPPAPANKPAKKPAAKSGSGWLAWFQVVKDASDTAIANAKTSPAPPRAATTGGEPPVRIPAAPHRAAPATPLAGGQPAAPRRSPVAAAPPRRTAPPRQPPVRRTPSSPPPAGGDRSVALLEQLLPADPGGAETQQLSLYDALARAAMRESRVAVIREYWSAALARANYYAKVDELNRLESISPASRGNQGAMLSAAVAAARARASQAQLEAVTAQHALASTAAWSGQSAPITSDRPFVGAYRTNFERLFPGGAAAPRVARQVHATLPLNHRLIGERAVAVEAAAQLFEQMRTAFERGDIPLSAVLQSHDELRKQREAFLAATGRYNNDIAQYALTVVRPNVSRETVVTMLLGARSAGNSVASGRSIVRPTTALEEVSPSGGAAGAAGAVVPASPGAATVTRPAPSEPSGAAAAPPALVIPPDAAPLIPTSPPPTTVPPPSGPVTNPAASTAPTLHAAPTPAAAATPTPPVERSILKSSR